MKQHGAPDKLDNTTCLVCMAPPSTYQDPACLANPAVFLEPSRVLGCSCMHLKIRCFELVFNVAMCKYVGGPLSAYKEELENDNLLPLKAKKKNVAEKKTLLEKEVLLYFQHRFEGPLGQGLRVFVPEPQKGGNSNTGVCASRFRIIFLLSMIVIPFLFPSFYPWSPKVEPWVN